MMYLKSCPRCETGDMYLDEDNSRHCFQCGYVQAGPAGADRLADLLQTIATEEYKPERAGQLAI